MRRYSSLPCVLSVLSILFVMTPVTARQNRPDMKLLVSTHSGPRPVDLTLTGSILGMKPEEFSACLLMVEWNDTTPGGQRLNSKKEMPCVEAEKPTVTPEKVPAQFSRQVTLEEAGTYSYRIVLVRNDGKRMASTSQEVKVYRSRLEMGAAKQGSLNRR
jgi:hypothetical protein